MNYWKLQIRNGDTGENFVDEALNDNRITTHEDYAQGFLEQAKEGDIVLIHKGAYPECLVKIKYKINNPSEINGTSFGHDYKVEVISWYKDVYNNKNIFNNPFIVGHNGTFTLLYNQSKTLKQVKKWHYHFLKKYEMKKFKDLLLYKKQIILQGPPGTGKTREAKLIADKILNADNEGLTPISLIESFFKKNSLTADNLGFQKKLQEFQTVFPKDQFLNMELDDYCIGKGNRNNFCWWIERGLEQYGKFTPGQSGNYVIYFSHSEQDYVVKKFNEPINEVFPKLKDTLNNLVNKEDTQSALNFFGESFILKILNSYYPDKYFPINGKKALENAVKIFNIDTKRKSAIELNKILQDKFLELKNKNNSTATALDFMVFLLKILI